MRIWRKCMMQGSKTGWQYEVLRKYVLVLHLLDWSWDRASSGHALYREHVWNLRSLFLSELLRCFLWPGYLEEYLNRTYPTHDGDRLLDTIFFSVWPTGTSNNVLLHVFLEIYFFLSFHLPVHFSWFLVEILKELEDIWHHHDLCWRRLLY